jgi:peroxiredoxin
VRRADEAASAVRRRGGTGLHAQGPERSARHPEQLPGRQDLATYENDDTATLAISVGPPPTHKVWATQSGFTFPVLSDFWPHGAVARSYGVFNGDTGFANRGTFVVDRSGTIRFAEMKQPGESRDQAVWAGALNAVHTG